MTFDGRLGNTGWISLTHEGTSGTVRYRALNGVVFVEIAVTIALPSGSNVALVIAPNEIPAAYRPAATMWQPGRCDAGTLGAQVGRNSDGTIGAIQNQGVPATGIQAAYSYPIG